MSAAVEAAADEPFLTFMRRRIFEPLGMDDTRADSATEPIPKRATFYVPRFTADPLEANVPFLTVMATKMPYLGRG